MRLIPKLIKIPPRFWIVANVLLLLLSLAFTVQIVLQQKEKAGQAVEEGKRFIIAVPTEEIIAREGALKEENRKKSEKTEEHATQEELPADEDIELSAADNTEQTPKEKPPVQGRVAFIITNLGLHEKFTEIVLQLPPEITLSFSPYAEKVDEWFAKAAEKGHEALIEIPMQSKYFPLADSGPFALSNGLTDEENITRLAIVLDRAENKTGVFSQLDENFTFSLVSLLPVLDMLKRRDMMFIYQERESNEFVRDEARAIALPFINRYKIVDAVQAEEVLDKNFSEIEQQALSSGFAVAVGRPYPLTIKKLYEWIKTLEDKGIELVPVSHIVKS